MNDPIGFLTICRIRETFVYRIDVSKRTHRGYRAEDWGLASPFAACELVVRANDTHIKLELVKTSNVLASSILLSMAELSQTMNLSKFLEPVVDSSRYFVCPFLVRSV